MGGFGSGRPSGSGRDKVDHCHSIDVNKLNKAGRLTLAQPFGEALDPDKLERLGRYELHLDRKLERMLSKLLRLKELRQGTIEG